MLAQLSTFRENENKKKY